MFVSSVLRAHMNGECIMHCNQAVGADISGVHTLRSVQQQQQPHQQQQVDADDNIKVVVRVRPLFPVELAKGATNVITVAEDSSSLQVSQPHSATIPCAKFTRCNSRLHDVKASPQQRVSSGKAAAPQAAALLCTRAIKPAA